MSFLTTSEFNKKLVEEISSVTEDLHVVSAFCKNDAVKFFEEFFRIYTFLFTN